MYNVCYLFFQTCILYSIDLQILIIYTNITLILSVFIIIYPDIGWLCEILCNSIHKNS